MLSEPRLSYVQPTKVFHIEGERKCSPEGTWHILYTKHGKISLKEKSSELCLSGRSVSQGLNGLHLSPKVKGTDLGMICH